MDGLQKVVLDDPSSGHSHLRDDGLLDVTIPENHPYSCVVHIPNTKDPVDSGERLAGHQKELMAKKPTFDIIWGIMLTKRTTKEGIKHAHDLGARFIKYIPADASTHSTSGIGITLDEFPNHFDKLAYGFDLNMASLNHMERIRTKEGVEISFEHREEAAIPDTEKLLNYFPGEKIRIEHVSTRNMLEFLKGKKVRMAFTPQHACKTYGQVFDATGNRIHENFCMPILKPYADMLAIREEMISGNYDNSRFGPDDAIHPWPSKLKGVPGVFLPPSIALPILCEIFERSGNISKLNEFTRFSEEDENFFGIKLTRKKQVVLERTAWTVAETISGKFVPFMHGQQLAWKIKEVIEL